MNFIEKWDVRLGKLNTFLSRSLGIAVGVVLVLLLLAGLLVLAGCDGVPIPIPTPTPTPTPPPAAGYDCNAQPILSGEVTVKGGIKGQYTVVLKKTKKQVVSASGKKVEVEVDLEISTVKGAATRLGAKDVRTFRNGFSAKFDALGLQKLRTDPAVHFFHESVPMSIPKPVKPSAAAPVWGLDRINQLDLPLDGNADHGGIGAAVHVVVNDTGIASHAEFENRLSSECHSQHSFGCADMHDHGTHVSGTVAGKTFGVAPGVVLHACRSLDQFGSGTDADVIACRDWTIDLKRKHPDWNIVLTESLGGDAAPSIDRSSCDVYAAGIPLTIAAGNDGANACNTSPARVKQALTIGASDRDDNAAYFSNFGGCVDIYGPGVDIESAKRNGSSTLMSGTSMATPHAAGVVAVYLAKHPLAGPDDIYRAVLAAATRNTIDGADPNVFLFSKVGQ